MTQASGDTFGTRSSLTVGDRIYTYYSLERLEASGHAIGRLPYSIKILLEGLLRNEDGRAFLPEHVRALAAWDPSRASEREIPFMPARVLLQDFTGVPALVDLAAMRDAVEAAGGDPRRINPLLPSELVIDHSVQVDVSGTPSSLAQNMEKDYSRNGERYAFMRWGQKAFDNLRVVPPGTGIVHQVNVEYLARVVFDRELEGRWLAYPDTLVGTDSHTTMVNGLGVLGWGVGGIEAEAAMLGQPISLLIPRVIGFKLEGRLPEGATATDLVLTVTQMLRAKGVVGKFVEFHGEGLSSLSLADRATLGNMSPEYGSTCGIFPIDQETLDYLEFSGREPERVALVEAYAKAQGIFHTPGSQDPVYTDTLGLDLGTVEASMAGPKRPHDRVPLRQAKKMFLEELPSLASGGKGAPAPAGPAYGEEGRIGHGAVVVAAITSCTNTSNPAVMVGAGILAKNAVERGLSVKPWVKTSLAPGSKVVTDYLRESGLLPYLESLRFHVVGYGCTTCIGNTGPLPEEVEAAIREGNLVAVSVLSGNRNFEGRIHPMVRANYLASPPLVVAYALAGRMDVDLHEEPLGKGKDGKEIFLREIWPSPEEIRETIRKSVRKEMFSQQYGKVFEGDDRWRALPVPEGERFTWRPESTYLRLPTFLKDVPVKPAPLADLEGARVLVSLGDSVTTDHISPAGSIAPDSPAGGYLIERGVQPAGFNSYGSRRGNHEVMVRGTFANVRLRNQLAPGTEGWWTRHLPDGGEMTIYEASERYRAEGVPLIVLAGKEYGSGSSRDWAAKGPALLGIRAVIAESFERIHRSNLIGMGILPLQFAGGDSRDSLGLSGEENFAIRGIGTGLEPGRKLSVEASGPGGRETSFQVMARIDTPVELEYYRHGGILLYVLRQLM
jgi:aconitate hydratase